MTATLQNPSESRTGVAVGEVTVGQLRELVSGLDPATPLSLGVVDRHHVNTLLGTLPVTSVKVAPGAAGVVLVFHVPGVS
jgi:hypothetical protein